MSKCNEILKKGFYDEFEATTEREINHKFRQVLRIDRSELERIITESDTTAGISIPLAEAILALEIEDERSAEKLREIRESYSQEGVEIVSDSHVTWLISRTVNKDIVRAWERCVTLGGRGLRIELEGDPYGDFNIHVLWVPRSDAEAEVRSVKVRNLIVTGAVAIGEDEIYEGATIDRYTGIVSDFRRIGVNRGVISVAIEGQEPISLQLPPIVAKKVTKLRVVAFGKRRQKVTKTVSHSRERESVWREGRKSVDELWIPPQGWEIESFNKRMSRTLGADKDDCPGGVEAYREGGGIRMKFSVYHGPRFNRYRCRCTMTIDVVIVRQELVEFEMEEAIFEPQTKLHTGESASILDLSSVDVSNLDTVSGFRISVEVEDMDGVVNKSTGVFSDSPDRERLFINGVEIRRVGNLLEATNTTE